MERKECPFYRVSEHGSYMSQEVPFAGRSRDRSRSRGMMIG